MDGRSSVEETVCPSRLLAEAPWAAELIDWWTWSVRWDGMSGQPFGPPVWPFPGGLLRQPNRLVQACKVLRAEWPNLQTRTRPQERRK